MAVSQEALMKALKNVRKPLASKIKNARLRRVLHRIHNEDEDLGDFLGEDDVEDEDDEIEDGDDGGEEVGVGDVVEVEIPQGTTVTAQIVDTEPSEEIVEETEVVEDGDDEGEVVENRRQYRRVKNARIIRTKNGTLDVLVPVTETGCKGKSCGGRKVTNVRRYKVRSTRNAGYDPESAYAKKISGDGIDAISKATYNEMARKAKKYDRLVANATIDSAIDEAIKKALQENGITNRSTGSKAVRPVATRSRIRNYRRFNNDELGGGFGGGVGGGVAAPAIEGPAVGGGDAPFVDDAQNAIVIPLSDAEMNILADELNEAADGGAVVGGADGVVSENARRVLNRRLTRAKVRNARVRNARIARAARIRNLRNKMKSKNCTVKNEATKTDVKNVTVNNSIPAELSVGLDIPSTFPNK